MRHILAPKSNLKVPFYGFDIRTPRNILQQFIIKFYPSFPMLNPFLFGNVVHIYLHLMKVLVFIT